MKTNKLADKKIEQIYRETCSGVQIDMFDIPKIFKVGRACLDAGGDDIALRKAIVDFVQTIRKN